MDVTITLWACEQESETVLAAKVTVLQGESEFIKTWQIPPPIFLSLSCPGGDVAVFLSLSHKTCVLQVEI